MKHQPPDPAFPDDMTDDHAEKLLAEALEDYHRRRARGERPDEAAYRERLGDLYPLFVELIAAETIIDLALEPAGDETELPLAWGAYTLLREIARGAAGVVYEAIHRKLGRKVALKVLRTGVDTDKVARGRFHREAQALAHVKHDNIVEIYEFGEIDGRPYYAMSLVNGPSLKELIKQGKTPEPRELCRGLAGVADALAMLHSEGIIHRDVKPQNIMVDADGRYMLADFGLARSSLAETMTQSGDALGTPLYMSPEQILADRKAIDERSDIYGLGATLYEMLAHVPPFKTDNLQALMRMILQERPVSPRTIKQDLPKNSAGIALSCLEKEPRDRPQTAAALRDGLLAVAEDEQASAPFEPVSRPKRGLRLALAHPILSAAALVLVAVGIWALLKPPANVPVEVRIIPKTALARIEGVDAEFRRTDGYLRVELPPNRAYKLLLRPGDENFVEGEQTLPVGDKPRSYPPILLETDGTTAGALKLSREILELQLSEFQEIKVHRSGTRAPDAEIVAPLYPFGPTDKATLGPWLVLVEADFLSKYPQGAWLSWTADGTVLHSERFPGADMANYGALPADVLTKLTPGMRVTWGIADAKGGAPRPEFARTFDVVDGGLGEALARIDEAVVRRESDGPDVDHKLIADILRAETYLREGLPGAAVQTLFPLTVADNARVVDELNKADAEGREARDVPIRTTPYVLALLEQALLTELTKSKQRDRSLAWGTVQNDWIHLLGENARDGFYDVREEDSAGK